MACPVAGGLPPCCSRSESLGSYASPEISGGNFVSEWAAAHEQSVVNVGVFAAGGKEHLAGQTFNADERQDEPAFALLAGLAGSDAALFDLRDLRPILHAIPAEKRTPLEKNLTYWADSYDFLLCYPNVSPLMDPSADPR
jgi:hypothetical protein